MASITKLKPLSLYRSILNEFKLRKQINSPAQEFITNSFKSNKVTSLRHCRGQDAAVHDAETFLCMLNSSRIYDELIVKYHGDGEDTTEKAAARVGLSLPELYDDPKDTGK